MHRVMHLSLVLMLMIAFCIPAHAIETEEIQLALSSACSYTDTLFQDIAGSITTLSATTEVQSCSWTTMESSLESLQNNTPSSEVWFIQTSGTYYTVDLGLMPSSLSSESYFTTLMGCNPVAGEVFPGKIAGEYCALIAVPVLNLYDDAIGALAVTKYLDWIKTSMESNGYCPMGMQILVKDADGAELFTVGEAAGELTADPSLMVTSTLTGWTYTPLLPEE